MNKSLSLGKKFIIMYLSRFFIFLFTLGSAVSITAVRAQSNNKLASVPLSNKDLILYAQSSSTPAPTPQVLRAAMQQNFIEWPMNQGDQVELTNNFNSCSQFDSIRFTAKTYFKGKLTVKEVDKANNTYFPNKNNSYVFGVCEVSLEGFSADDVQNVSITYRYTKDWLQSNNLQSANIRLFTSTNNNAAMQLVNNSNTTGEKDNYILLQSSLDKIPSSFAVASLGGEAAKSEALSDTVRENSSSQRINFLVVIGSLLVAGITLFILWKRRIVNAH
jgi:PGF-pre-PGF domain-containing protein